MQYGAPRVIRTPDLLVRSQTLYPAELWAHFERKANLFNVPAPHPLLQLPSRVCHNTSIVTERLYYTDSYLRRFSARIVDRSPDGLTVYLDRTAFYPTSGGQPFDTGSLSGIPVVDVVDEDDRIAHRIAAPAPPVAEVEADVDWTRRFDHMQQHSGQHLLSAVFEELYHLKTVSFHLGADSSTIDLDGIPVDARVLEETERRANEVIWENRPVT